MLNHLGLKAEAERLEKAVAAVIAEGKAVTYDLKGRPQRPDGRWHQRDGRHHHRPYCGGLIQRGSRSQKKDGSLNQNSYRNLIAQRGGRFDRQLLRSALRGISVFYRSAVAARNIGYATGLLRSYAADVPVISVGNITTGGTGKTPLVVWLCRRLHEKGRRCAVLTRGYKTANGNIDDEPAILKKACPEAKVIVDPDRVAGAWRAVQEFGADVLVMDDGFQHRRLRRDLDILASTRRGRSGMGACCRRVCCVNPSGPSGGRTRS